MDQGPSQRSTEDDVTEPEKMIWAAVFASDLQENGLSRTQMSIAEASNRATEVVFSVRKFVSDNPQNLGGLASMLEVSR